MSAMYIDINSKMGSVTSISTCNQILVLRSPLPELNKRNIRNGRKSVAEIISRSEEANSSWSVARFIFLVSFRKRCARFFKMTGANVSGTVQLNRKLYRTIQSQELERRRRRGDAYMTAAKIMFTQKIHRHPIFSPTNPPTIGPSTGPP